MTDPLNASPVGSPLVVISEAIDDRAAAWLSGRCRVVRAEPGDGGFDAHLAEAEGLVVRTYTRVDGALLDRASRLRVVGRAGVGLDNVDVNACRARGIEVVHTPRANTRAVVEYVTALMLDGVRPRPCVEEPLGRADWSRARAGAIAPRQLAGSTLGICGLGNIGSQVARVGRALDMRVIYTDLVEIAPEHRHGASPVAFEELLSESDILTVHVDDRRSNRGLFGAGQFALCRDDVVLINASRGFVVDRGALALFLGAHPRAMALLDVHDPEPIPAGDPLLAMTNCVLHPHIGAATAAAHEAMSWVVRDVARVLGGEAPEWPAPAGRS